MYYNVKYLAFYNASNKGVDSVDNVGQICSTYNCARNTRRWPMYNFLNVT